MDEAGVMHLHLETRPETDQIGNKPRNGSDHVRETCGERRKKRAMKRFSREDARKNLVSSSPLGPLVRALSGRFKLVRRHKSNKFSSLHQTT
jgi:hypothetical protein